MPSSVSIRVEQPSTTTPASVHDVDLDVDVVVAVHARGICGVMGSAGSARHGIGGIRRMRLVLGVTRDRIVDATRPHHQAYAATFPW